MKKHIVSELLYEKSRKYGEKTAVSLFQGKEYSYLDYQRAVKELEAGFLEADITEGEIVILQFPDCPACIASFLTLLKLGAKPLLVSTKAEKKFLEEICAKTECGVIVTQPELLRREYPIGVGLIEVGGFEGTQNIYSRQILRRSRKKSPFIEDSVAYLTLTSGSSGKAKIVMHAQEELLYASEQYAVKTLGIKKGARLFSVPKLNYTYGLAISFFYSFYTGAPAILMKDNFSPAQVCRYIEKYKPRYFWGVPAIYQRILDWIKGGGKKPDVCSVQYFISAGDSLSKELIFQWEACFGKIIIDSVGCSETGSGYLINLPWDGKLGSAGRRIEGYELRLDLPEQDMGVLFVKSKSNAAGYFRNPKEEAKKFCQEWINTGDIFRVDEDGYYWFCGRMDDMLKHRGMWISSIEVERAICRYQGVTEAVVSKCSHNGKTSFFAAIAVDADFDSVEQLEKFLRSCLSHYKCPEKYLILKEIPRNPNGKADLPKIKEYFKE